MTIYLDKIQKIICKFQGKDKERLTSHYVSTSKNILLNEKEVKRSKLNLLQDLHSMNIDEIDKLLEDVLNHKILQIRALILDLVNNDYSVDCETVYKPEKWIKQIAKDASETFDLDSDFGLMMFMSYNEKLLEEFCDIFISENCKFGSNGNQLLLNFYFYKVFASKKSEFVGFEDFFNRMKSSFKRDNFKSEEDLEKILNGK